MRVYKVRVALPLKPRERKQVVHTYRMCAESEGAVVAAMVREIESRQADGFDSRGWVILSPVQDFSALEAVVLESVSTRTPS